MDTVVQKSNSSDAHLILDSASQSNDINSITIEPEVSKIDIDLEADKKVIIDVKSNEKLFILCKEITESASALNTQFESDSDAIINAAVNKVNDKIDEISLTLSNFIIKDLMSEADEEEGNPLVAKEVNKARENTLNDLAKLSLEKLEETYPYIRAFDYSIYKVDCLPLEKEKLLLYFYAFGASHYRTTDNKKSLEHFCGEMLSGEYCIYLEDFARL